MNDIALLPKGFYDLLTEEANHKATVSEALRQFFIQYGYEYVDPPLLEFETSLFAGAGAALEEKTFRVLDPAAEAMAGIRADITPQIARIASTRLENKQKPLRLSYLGEVLRVKGQGLYKNRQLTQAGIEIIGTDKLTADAEIIALAIKSIQSLGLNTLSLDFTIPAFVEHILEDISLEEEEKKELIYALQKKEVQAIKERGKDKGELLASLATPGVSIEAVIEQLEKTELPAKAAAQMVSLKSIVADVTQRCPNLSMTADLIEYNGLTYHNGVCFSIFETQTATEIAKGGRYTIPETNLEAAGCSLYVNPLLRLVEKPTESPRITITKDTPEEEITALHSQGKITIYSD